MITAGRALEQDRDLFAVPGAVDMVMSEGTNRLIQQGAKLVTCGQDILEEYWSRFPLKLKSSAPLTPEAARQRLERQEERTAPPAPAKKAAPEENGEEPKPELIPLDRQKERFTDDQLALLRAMKGQPRSAEALVELTQIPARRVQSALTMLQVDGAVQELPGRRFAPQVRLEEAE